MSCIAPVMGILFPYNEEYRRAKDNKMQSFTGLFT